MESEDSSTHLDRILTKKYKLLQLRMTSSLFLCVSASFSEVSRQRGSVVRPLLAPPAVSSLDSRATVSGESWRLAAVGSRSTFDPGHHRFHPLQEVL